MESISKSTKTLEERKEPPELGAAGEVPVKKGLQAIKKIGATSAQQKSLSPANAVADTGSYMPWVALDLSNGNKLKALTFGEDSYRCLVPAEKETGSTDEWIGNRHKSLIEAKNASKSDKVSDSG